ncbi:hypothetical protein QBC37DRAFT_372011 [Rhypophila decipiens]|uniref:Uncharacterized protein n=1 Tax=Rhypophila decipiens TaxID=261697 RepID=A0AAN7B9F7_9PEZI|nr:hypothetical protein QBC37DRAFT_372011 [Rhypophila decipiens]
MYHYPKSTPTCLFPHLPPDKRKDPYRTLPGLARLILAATMTPLFAYNIFKFSTTTTIPSASSTTSASSATGADTVAKTTAKFSKSALKYRAISCWLAVDCIYRVVREIRLDREARSRLDLDLEMSRSL